MAEDALDDRRIFDRRKETESPAAVAGENVDLKDAAQQLGPREVSPGRSRRRRRRCGRDRCVRGGGCQYRGEG